MSGIADCPSPRPMTETLQPIRATALPRRPAWVEIDLAQLRRNFALLRQDKPAAVEFAAVVKDDAYGHGVDAVAAAALDAGASFLALSTLDETLALRDRGVTAPLLLLGDRPEAELPWCVDHWLTVCVTESRTAKRLGELAAARNRRLPVHVKVNTGMNRYGVRWTDALPLIEQIHATPSLRLEGVMSHFAQSDEADKTFAELQLARFNAVLAELTRRGVEVRWRHLCNSGGFLDLPAAHFDLVRLGLLPLGVFPSAVCRRIPGLAPVMTVKARLAAVQQLEPGDAVGYGMRYVAPSRRRIGVLPLGYGDGFPRVRNEGAVLVHGRRAPLVGGVAMDAFTVDITEIPQAGVGDEAVVMGRQGGEEISVHELAHLKRSVSYDVLTNWRGRLPRVYLDPATAD